MLSKRKRIDDYWNIDGSRDLSDSWTGFSQFTLLEEKPPDGYMWSRERLTRKQLTSRPDHLWPETLKEIGKKCPAEGEAKSGHMKNQNSIMPENYEEFYFIDPQDKQFKETIKNARKKLETPMAPAMPCKTSKKQSVW